MPDSDNRIGDGLSTATTDPKTIETTNSMGPSPTGTPLVPAKYVPYLMAGVAISAALAGFLPAGLPTALVSIAGVIFTILLGGSPGLRK